MKGQIGIIDLPLVICTGQQEVGRIEFIKSCGNHYFCDDISRNKGGYSTGSVSAPVIDCASNWFVKRLNYFSVVIIHFLDF